MASKAKANGVYAVGVFLCLLALVLAVIGFATPNWYTSKVGDTSHSLGLWQVMTKIQNSISVTSDLGVSAKFSPFFEATRAMSSVGTILLIISFLVTAIGFCVKYKRVVGGIVTILLLLAAIVLIVAVSLFGGYIHLHFDATLIEQEGNSTFIDYSLYLQAAAAGLALISCFFFCAVAAIST